MSKLTKPYRLIAVIVALSLIVSGLLFSLGSFGSLSGNAASKEAASDGDRAIAADISNLTGVASDRVLQMKASGQSWNEILAALKTKGGKDNPSDKEQRAQQLLGMGLGEEAVARLRAEGFAEADILSAKLLAERAISQMQELMDETSAVMKAPTAPKAPNPEFDHTFGGDSEETFLQELQGIVERFDLEKAVWLMLTLKSKLGSYENVLDEYLGALQLGLNLEDYSRDPKQYEKDKERKSAETINQPVITLSELERKLLDKIQAENATSREEPSVSDPSYAQPSPSGNGSLPELPLPSVKDVLPENPAKAIEDELSRINPNESMPK